MRAQSTITKVTENLSLRLSCAIRSSFLCVLWWRIVKQANKCNQAESNEKWADWQQAESQRLRPTTVSMAPISFLRLLPRPGLFKVDREARAS